MSNYRFLRNARVRVAFGALAIVLLASGSALAAVQIEASYSDANDASAFYVTAAGCMEGYPDGTFRPNDAASRVVLSTAVYSCAARAGFVENAGSISRTSREVVVDRIRTGAQAADTGGFYTLTVPIELATTSAPTGACSARFTLDARGNGDGGQEQVILDLRPGVAVQRLNATMVDRIRSEVGNPLNHEIIVAVRAVLSGAGCPQSVPYEAALSSIYTPFDSNGAPAVAP